MEFQSVAQLTYREHNAGPNSISIAPVFQTLVSSSGSLSSAAEEIGQKKPFWDILQE